MNRATLRNAALEIAKHGGVSDRQMTALAWLDMWLPDQLAAGFTERWREPAAAPPAPKPAAQLVTAEQAQAVFQQSVTAGQLADLNACLARFQINTPSRIRHFLAQIHHESGGLRWLRELADGTAYEGRRDLGNTQPGDGPRFKGAGVLQLTGRANYQALADATGDRRVMEGCAYVAAIYPFTSAGLWWQRNRINAEVDAGADCRRISRLVNGRDPANGLADRLLAYERACRVIPLAASSGQSTTHLAPEPQFYSQRDNGAQADRTCLTSSCAMLAKTLLPKALSGSNADLDHLARVNRYGDTTDASAQLRALADLGITARLVTNASWGLLEEQLRRGRGVCLGFIHRGPVGQLDPRCDGHWLFCWGIDATHLTVHDPGGELDLVAGGFVAGGSGRGQRYSRANFGRRWLVREVPGGWQEAPGCGWAIVVDGVKA